MSEVKACTNPRKKQIIQTTQANVPTLYSVRVVMEHWHCGHVVATGWSRYVCANSVVPTGCVTTTVVGASSAGVIVVFSTPPATRTVGPRIRCCADRKVFISRVKYLFRLFLNQFQKYKTNFNRCKFQHTKKHNSKL